MSIKIIIKNKKAWHNYEILERFEAGIVLVGTEVKSLRLGKAKMVDAFCQINASNQLELYSLHISPYDYGNRHNHPPERVRRLLMHQQEIQRLLRKVQEKGLTIIPTMIYFKKNWIKIEVSLAKGKKLYDKRQVMLERATKREIEQAIKLQR